MFNIDVDKIWERQPWETEISFGHFQKFYLLQVPPRSLVKAYRRYLVEARGWDENDIIRKPAPGSWQRWHKGKDNQNNPAHPDAVGWEERADAYDKYTNFTDNEEERIIRSRNLLKNKEYQHATQQLQLWEMLFESFQEMLEREKHDADEAGHVFNPTPYILKVKELWKMREEITTFLRRTLLLPDKYRNDQLPDEDDETPTEFVWTEPDFKASDVGVGADTIMELMTGGKSTDQEG